jgi:hypothetical protein
MKNLKPVVVELADNSPEIIQLVNRLADRGWRVHLIGHVVPAIKSLNPNVQVHKLPITTAYPMTYAAFLAAAPMILRIKPDIVHAHYLTRFGILAAVYRRFLRFKPMMLTVLGDDIFVESRKGMTRWSAEHALKMFEVITCNSENLASGLHELETPADKIEQVDLSAEAKDNSDKAMDRLEAIYLKLIESQSKNRK